MCRYAQHLYKQHLACFACRKVWRQERVDEAIAPLCPDCHQPLTDMGKDFKAPRRDATKQWAKAEALVKNGIRFSSCGCGGPGPMPQRLNEVEAFVEARALSVAEQAAESERRERQRAKEERLAEVWDRREQQRVRQYQKKLSRPAD
ncbi:hypothetical protein [Armatimonas sp.]|uniref:hypothetical protein n=1 Tax=Armatimonas sp. TaxID=1872638 RepID=UPI00286C7D86|nr:hypothetical protein [Armatimonas sp.]